MRRSYRMVENAEWKEPAYESHGAWNLGGGCSLGYMLRRASLPQVIDDALTYAASLLLVLWALLPRKGCPGCGCTVDHLPGRGCQRRGCCCQEEWRK